jgi:hypothetical protein
MFSEKWKERLVDPQGMGVSTDWKAGGVLSKMEAVEAPKLIVYPSTEVEY